MTAVSITISGNVHTKMKKRSYAVGNLVNILLKSTEVINRKDRLMSTMSRYPALLTFCPAKQNCTLPCTTHQHTELSLERSGPGIASYPGSWLRGWQSESLGTRLGLASLFRPMITLYSVQKLELSSELTSVTCELKKALQWTRMEYNKAHSKK